VTVDKRQRLPGRGAYLCRSELDRGNVAPGCLQAAMRRSAIARALRAPLAELELARRCQPSAAAAGDPPLLDKGRQAHRIEH